VLTAHDVLPREPGPGQVAALIRAYRSAAAVVVHSEHGRARLVREAGVLRERIHVIPHGAFTHLLEVPDPAPLPAELAAVERPVVLLFGLMRPYKGIEVALEAWRGIDDAELWVVGMPRMDTAPLKAAAGPNVRFVERFVEDREIAAFMQRADLVLLPYREIDQSGVLFTALAFGRPLVLSAVGGFPEVADAGAARLVPPGDPVALRAAVRDLLDDPGARAALADGAAAAARERFGWDAIARAHLELYATLTG
jgi:glycosyltransferase involved in cell wall biosynthesis